MFKPSKEDNVIDLYAVWGLDNQDRSACHFTDFKCTGQTMLDRSFDMNAPPCQMAMLVRRPSLYIAVLILPDITIASITTLTVARSWMVKAITRTTAVHNVIVLQ